MNTHNSSLETSWLLNNGLFRIRESVFIYSIENTAKVGNG